MIGDMGTLWLTTDLVVSTYSVTIGSAWVRVLPADPLRWAVLLPIGTALSASYAFGESYEPGVPQFNTGIPDQIGILTRLVAGDLICRPLWVICGVPAFDAGFVSLSIDPNKWSKYERIIKQWLSNAGAL